MASAQLAGRGVFASLVVAIGAVSLLEVATSGGGGLVRWSGCSVLIPLLAACLLPFWQTLTVAALTLAAAVAIYGFQLADVSLGGKIVVLSLVMVSCLASLLVCRVRLSREGRLRDVMIARDRLALLSAATSRIGSTLDVVRTTRELAEVATSGFSDFVSVDLLESVLKGEEPLAGPLTGPVALRRVAQRSVLPGSPESPLSPGEGEVYPKVSLPAWVLAATQPVRAVHLDDADVGDWLANDLQSAALSQETDIHSAIAVPLSARGAVLGTVMFLRHQHPVPFDDDDLVLAGEIASRAAVCVDNARRYTHERDTSVILQRSLLPRSLPRLSAVEAASRYQPAGTGIGVGGDWFDLIPLSGARVAMVVGDVVGHGLQASASMARLRAAVRTLADIDLPPDELLTHLDDVVIRLGSEFVGADGGDGATGADVNGTDFGATCLYAVYDPVTRRCVLARAGHPPPVLVLPDGTAKLLHLPAGPPLGLGSLPFESTEVELPEGSLLALYTDGLIESWSEDLDQRVNTLLETLARPVADLDAACELVLESMLDGPSADDVALLIVRTNVLDRNHVVTWSLPTDPAAVSAARHQVSDQLSAWGLEDFAFTTELMVSELVTNAIRHARPPVRLRIIHERNSLICEVSDGSNTSPHLRRARTFDEDGRGLFIVARLAERWGTRYDRDSKTIWAEQATAAQ